MNRQFGFIASFVSMIIFSGLTGCTQNSKTVEDADIKGDLALLQLCGDVSSLIMDGEIYRFDENGMLSVDGARDTVNDEGLRCIVFDDISEERMHGPTRPYTRIYDGNGRLQEVWTYYGSRQMLDYDEEGKLSGISWEDEGYSGNETYSYTDGIMTLCESHDYGFMQEQDEASSSDIVAFDVDTKGNWTRRFLIVRDAKGKAVNHLLQEREIHYHSGDATMDTGRSRLILSGKIDEEDVIIGLKQMNSQENAFCAMMLYKESFYGAAELSYDFPALQIAFKRLDGFSRCEFKGELSADPQTSASVSFVGTVQDTFYLMGESIEGKERPCALKR